MVSYFHSKYPQLCNSIYLVCLYFFNTIVCSAEANKESALISEFLSKPLTYTHISVGVTCTSIIYSTLVVFIAF